MDKVEQFKQLQEEMKGHGLTVIYDPLIAYIHGISIAAVREDGIILLASGFFNFDYEVQRFILYHELGHFTLGHHKQNKVRDYFNRLHKKLTGWSKIELAADLYAIKVLGANVGVQALSDTIAYLQQKYDGVNYTELNKRLEQAKCEDFKSRI